MEEQETIASMLVDQLSSTPEWMKRGKCADYELDPFDPDHKEAFIREKCGQCPVVKQCESHFGEHAGLVGVFYGKDH